MDREDPWSVTDRSIHDTLAALRDDDADAAVATVVDVEGSAYRRPGAKLLAPADGDALGAVTAGCLDGPVNSLAADVRASRQATVETFDLTDDEEWGLGLGCNGVIDLLVDPLDDSYDALLGALADHEAATVLTVVASDDPEVPVGARTIVTADGDATGSDRPGLPVEALESLWTETDVPYVGLMGPRERFEELQDALVADGVSLSQAELDRVSTPVGLDLGDGSPTGIALSIVAEATAVANDASGGRLRDRSGPVHPRVDPSA